MSDEKIRDQEWSGLMEMVMKHSQIWKMQDDKKVGKKAVKKVYEK